MRTIAVLTDFSERSVHATRFAMHMAKKMRAHILLFNLSAVPAVRQLQAAGYNGDRDNEAENCLAAFSLKMEVDMRERTFPGTWLPDVSFNADSTEMVDVITAIVNNKEVELVVTAPNANQDLETFIMGDHCQRIIEWASVPVLVIPENAVVKNFEKIVFSTNFHPEDIHSIAQLGTLMDAFSAELMVAHLNATPSDPALLEAGRSLNRDLYQKISCGGVYFRSIPDVHAQKDWQWLKVNKRSDILAVVQQPKEAMSRFFSRGRGAQVTHHITIPVMVLPKRP